MIPMKTAQDKAMSHPDARSAEPVLRDLVVERRAIEQLIPYIRNARTHSDAQVAQVAGSIAEFGCGDLILIGNDTGPAR
jgi:hypothetical protein